MCDDEITRSEIIKTAQDTLGHALHKARFQMGLNIKKVSQKTNIPVNVIDQIEMGQCDDWDDAFKLLFFYNKKIVIELEE